MEEIYNVVKIIDEENIVINAGSSNYIKKGDKFEIYSIGDEVFDLDGQTSLGTLDTIKATLTVVTVFPKMCICQEIKTFSSPLTALGGLATYKDTTVSLSVDEKEISGGLSDDLTIKIGDLARLSA